MSYHVSYHGYSFDTPAIYQLLQSIGSGYWQAKNILPGNLECLVVQTCHSPMSENDRAYVETQNQFDFLGALPISDTRKVEYSAFNAVTFNWHRLIGAAVRLIVSKQESRVPFLKW
jgi:hypothetical protein